MVTEKYLLRSEAEWVGRQKACGVLDEIVACCARAMCAALAMRQRAISLAHPDHHPVGDHALH